MLLVSEAAQLTVDKALRLIYKVTRYVSSTGVRFIFLKSRRCEQALLLVKLRRIMTSLLTQRRLAECVDCKFISSLITIALQVIVEIIKAHNIFLIIAVIVEGIDSRFNCSDLHRLCPLALKRFMLESCIFRLPDL